MSEATRRGRKTATGAARHAKWRQQLLDQDRCSRCGEADPSRLFLEEHHVAGRANDHWLTIILCRNCHAYDGEHHRTGGVTMKPPGDDLERLIAILGGIGQFLVDAGATLMGWAEWLRLFLTALDEDLPSWRSILATLPNPRDLAPQL